MSTPRRNGQLSSCEPCRKSKLRCDHSSPVCKRCLARGRSDLCLYHPAPLTKPSQKIIKTRPKAATKNSQATSFTEMFDWVYLTPSSPHSLTQELASNQPKASISRPGFLGATSHSETFAIDSPEFGPPQNADIDSNLVVNPRQVEVGAQILSLLEHLPFYTDVIEERYKFFQGWLIPPHMIRWTLEALNRQYQTTIQGLSVDDARPRLREWSRAIFHTTASTIKTHPEMSLSEYATAVAQRWETIGIIFALTGTATYQIAPGHPVLHREDMPGENRHGLRQITAAVSEMCLQFCNSLGTTTDILCWLTMQHTMHLCKVYGTIDHRAWQSLGNVTSLVFTLGLHQRQTDMTAPHFLPEIRKRSMVAAYTMDKDFATFLGRPPRICWRYCDFQSPLDLTWEEVISETDGYNIAVQQLDPNGWRVDRGSEQGSESRVMLLTSIIREKILEVSLSSETDDLEERVRQICNESNQMRLNLPAFLHWTPKTQAPYIASLHLEFLYQDFLLWQSLLRRTGRGSEELINKSREILNLLLDTVGKQMRKGSISHFSTYDLSFTGLPVAGVLATQLLRDSQAPAQALPEAVFPRSEVIQNLSVYATYLEIFFSHQEGGYEECMKAQMYIRQVLDRVLSPNLGALSAPLPTNSGETTGVEDMDLMALLESFDWEQEIRLCFS